MNIMLMRLNSKIHNHLESICIHPSCRIFLNPFDMKLIIIITHPLHYLKLFQFISKHTFLIHVVIYY